jgi:ubiquinone/menaquinone biosynthesis C-methylase UbiE
MSNYTDYNAEVIDKWTDGGWEWGVPISHDVYEAAKRGEWDVLLTPIKQVPHDWFAPFLKDGRLDGVKLLGLACGGGQQMPIFQALGADCTVLDYSPKMLEAEEIVARREGYAMGIVRADMSKPLPFEDESFDVIFHPISNVYVEDIQHIWNECYRILKPGGILMAGCDNGFNFLIENDTEPIKIENVLPFNPLRNPEHRKLIEGFGDAYQFSHTYAEQVGGQLKAGFRLTDLYDDTNNAGALYNYNVPTFVATRSIKEKAKEDAKA